MMAGDFLKELLTMVLTLALVGSALDVIFHQPLANRLLLQELQTWSTFPSSLAVGPELPCGRRATATDGGDGGVEDPPLPPALTVDMSLHDRHLVTSRLKVLAKNNITLLRA